MLDQPVYCTSPMISHCGFTRNSTEKFAIAGSVMSDVTLRPYSAWLLTPAASALTVGASAAGIVDGSDGFSKPMLPCTSYLISDR